MLKLKTLETQVSDTIVSSTLMSFDEQCAVSRAIEKHHAIFYTFWEMGSAIFTEEAQTAEIRFDTNGKNPSFYINPKMWSSLNQKDKAFLVCHEMMHSILNHGVRIRDCENKNACSAAVDIIVNELLVNRFGFKRQELSLNKEGCFVDTVFKEPFPPTNKTFEYYYNLLQQQGGINENIMICLHDYLFGGADGIDEFLKELNGNIPDEDKEKIKDILQNHTQMGDLNSKAGSVPGSTIWTFAGGEHIVKKKKWETVIKEWAMKQMKVDFRPEENWLRVNRRWVDLPEDLILPTEMELEDNTEEKDKIEVYFFLDTSGSCYGLKERFIKAAYSLPEDKFKIRAFCFDTKVYNVTLDKGKTRLYGFGGTSFSILESKIQSIMKAEKVPYPKAVFLITDGYGDHVYPEMPLRWYWFLSDNFRDYIPSKCNIYMLKDFE
jgi:hypothetical protein